MGSVWENVFPLTKVISADRAINFVVISIQFKDLMMNLWKLRLKILYGIREMGIQEKMQVD